MDTLGIVALLIVIAAFAIRRKHRSPIISIKEEYSVKDDESLCVQNKIPMYGCGVGRDEFIRRCSLMSVEQLRVQIRSMILSKSSIENIISHNMQTNNEDERNAILRAIEDIIDDLDRYRS